MANYRHLCPSCGLKAGSSGGRRVGEPCLRCDEAPEGPWTGSAEEAEEVRGGDLVRLTPSRRRYFCAQRRRIGSRAELARAMRAWGYPITEADILAAEMGEPLPRMVAIWLVSEVSDMIGTAETCFVSVREVAHVR